MFSGSRRMVGPRNRRPERETEPHDIHVSSPCRVKVVTRGLALMLALMLVGLTHLSWSSSPRPVAVATSDRFSGTVKALVLPAADRRLYGCNADGTLTAWDPRSSQARLGASQGTYSLGAAFASDGSTVAVVDLHGVISLWDLARWRRWAEIPPRSGISKALAFSRDGTTLATADGSGVRLWVMMAANVHAGPRLDLRGVSCLAFAADGRTLAIGTRDGMVRLWDSARTNQAAQFQAHSQDVESLAFNDDGRLLATSSTVDTVARLWDPATGRLLKELDGRSPVQAVAFAPGTRGLATAGFDGAVRLWDLATGESCWVLSEHDGPVTALAFSADGATLACGGMGAIRLYRIDVSSLSVNLENRDV